MRSKDDVNKLNAPHGNENENRKLDGYIVWNAHNTVLGKEALLIYIVPVCYVKQVGMERPSNICHVLAALSCYRLSHRDSTFVKWIAGQHLHDRCGLRDRTCVGPRRVSCLHGPTRAER